MDIDWDSIRDRLLSRENLLSSAVTGGIGLGLYELARRVPPSVIEKKTDRKTFNRLSSGIKADGVQIKKDRNLSGNAYGNGYNHTVTIPGKGFRSAPVLAHEAGHATGSRFELEATRANNMLSHGTDGRSLYIPDRVAGLAGLFNTVRGFVGGPDAYRDMITAAGLSSALFIPRAVSELGASARGALRMRNAGGSLGDQLGAFGGVPSHLYTAALPWLPILGKATYEWLRNRR